MSNIYLLSNVKSNQNDVNNFSIFDINFIKPDIDFTLYDALIFTSKNAIYSLEYYNIDYKQIPSYAIALKTANILKECGANIVYTGISGHGNEFANEIKEQLLDKKVLYVRAKKIVSSLVNILKCDEIIVYETICKNKININSIKENAIIVFTSPSTIKCFFEQHVWHVTYLAICIGKTTASYLPNEVNYLISNETSIDSCIELARTI